ncbi:MAG: hypothetical protein JST92_17200, partial [Deltaproteobacteria bacterium]|nr:hypothetical protein [Deltaproteobacteria bacterium]
MQPTQLQTYSHTVQTGSTSGTSSGTTLNTNALVLNCALLGTCPPDDTGDAPFFDTHNGDSPLNLKGFIDQLWTSNPPRIDTSVDYPHLNCNIRISRTGGGLVTDALKTNMYWVDVCNFTNLLLEEWGRKLDGKGSCLDPKSTACDWMPQDLVDRLQNKNVDIAAAAKEQTYAYCKRFTYGDQLTTGGQPISAYNRSYLSTMDSVLQQRYNALGQLMKNIPIKATDDFGILKSDKQHIGDDQFGGGYGYDLGWHLKVMQRDANQQICRL